MSSRADERIKRSVLFAFVAGNTLQYASSFDPQFEIIDHLSLHNFVSSTCQNVMVSLNHVHPLQHY